MNRLMQRKGGVFSRGAGGPYAAWGLGRVWEVAQSFPFVLLMEMYGNVWKRM